MALPALLAGLAPYLPSLGQVASGLGSAAVGGLGHYLGNKLAGPGGIGGSPQGPDSSKPRLSMQQRGALNDILNQGLSGLQNNKFDFAPIAQQARTQFNQQTIPSIAERFTAMGGGGGRSGAFAQQLGQAGANLETNLAALQSQYGLQQQGNLLRMLGLGLSPMDYPDEQMNWSQQNPEYASALFGLLQLLQGLSPAQQLTSEQEKNKAQYGKS
jgi:hypothetical protein